MGYEINWHTNPGDDVLKHPFYQQFSYETLGNLDENIVKTALASSIANRDSAAICAYLSWILRCKALLA
tara:strand:- start:291 stop:497 length:207 start_codon:yes stop_codon:yes gene_type:complete